MAKLKPSASKKAKYTTYKHSDRFTKNARLKLERHLKKHPEDAQAAIALKNVGSLTFRTAPKERLGWVTESLKNFMFPTTATRGASRDFAKVVAFKEKVSRTSRTKEEQVLWRKVLAAQATSKVALSN